MGQSRSKYDVSSANIIGEIPLVFYQVFGHCAIHLSALDLVALCRVNKGFNKAVMKLNDHVWRTSFVQEIFFGRWIGSTFLFMIGPEYEPFGKEYLDESYAQPPQFNLIPSSSGVKWESLNWRQRVREYNRPALLDRLNSKDSVLRFEIRGEYFDKCFEARRDKNRCLVFAGDKWNAEEETVLRKCLYRYELFLQTPFGSTSTVSCAVFDEANREILKVSYPDDSCVLDQFWKSPSKKKLMERFATYEHEAVNGFKTKIEELGTWYK